MCRLRLGMFGRLVVGWDSSSNIEFGTFLFWVVLRHEGLGFEGGCFVGFLAWSEGLGSDESKGSFIFVGS